MPKLRIGFSTDFNLKDEQVGVGTDNPTARLDIRGDILAVNISDTGGISTISRYGGFLNPNLTLSERTSELSIPNKGNLNTLSGEIIIEGDTTVEDDTPLAGGRLDSLTVTGKFDLPHGGTEDREETPEKGSTRFNQDLGQLEFYTGLEWRTVGSYDGSGRGRGVFGGGITPTVTSVIQYINISSLGNSLNFGSLTASRGYTSVGNCSSSTRGLYGGGLTPALVNIIEYITIASEGNSIDFGDLSSPATGRYLGASCSSSIRGLFAGGYVPTAPASYSNVIDYVQISTIGNALDFGDLTTPKMCSGLSSPTRGIFSGGYVPGSTITQTMDVITMSSVGNAVSFGDMSVRRAYSASLSNATRGIYGGGIGPSSNLLNTIDFMTIATNGNAISFGDLSAGRRLSTGTSSQIRGIFAGGGNSIPAGLVNTIDYVTIASQGNAQDFGDMSSGNIQGVAACSDSHGGLGGF
jgi:hypothetical protein